MKNIKCRSCFFYRNEWCEKIVDSPDPEEVRDCAYFREMTNAQKIRSMSDEELAEFLIDLADDGNLKIREWLQQSSGEEDKHENYT